MNITAKLTGERLRELALDFQKRVAELRAINEQDYPDEAGDEEVEVSNEMLVQWQTFGGSPLDEALTESQAQELLRFITEVEMLNIETPKPKSKKGGPRPGSGRPAKKMNPSYRSINLSGDCWVWIDAQVGKGRSKNDVIEELIREKME